MTSPKVWFITGAARGFGLVWTEAALRRGDKVAATARDTTSLNDLAATYGDAVLILPLDVIDRSAVFDAVGVRIDTLPITPERILRALKAQAAG